ncbi:MAG TPA: TCR/Tet family MFS transporter [Saprospiraceae bacterium]|nr:TCR/Tet family MFS transporter [Saprospiraceae bacterium]
MNKRKAALGFIFVTLLIDVVGLGIIIPVMPSLLSGMTGGTISDASKYGGWLMFSFAIMQFLFSPVLGALSDQYGRRKVLLISMFGFCLDYLLMAWAPTLSWLFLGRIIAGITGASFTTAAAYIADISTDENRAQNFGMIGAAFGLGFIIGPTLGGILGNIGTRLPFMVSAGLTFINWLYGYFILPESLDEQHRRPFDIRRANPAGSLVQLKKYPTVFGLVGSLVFIYIAAHSVQSTWTYFNMYAFHWNEATVGYSLGFVGLLIALVQAVLIRYTIPTFGPRRSLYLGLLFYTLGLVLFAFATRSWMMFVFSIPYCLGGIAGPALQSTISGQVPRNAQGELQGALTSLMSLTSIIGPLLMTYVFYYFTRKDAWLYFPGSAFLLGAVLILLSTWIAYRKLGKP